MNLVDYRRLGFDQYQLNEIQRGYNDGVNILKYADKKYSHAQMYQIRLGLLDGNDITKYADETFTYAQMKEVRLAMMENVNPSILADSRFCSAQMAELRKGLEWHIDVRPYADPVIPYRDMIDIREALEWYDEKRGMRIDILNKIWTPVDIKIINGDTAILMKEISAETKAIAFWKNAKFIINVRGFEDLKELQKNFPQMKTYQHTREMSENQCQDEDEMER